MFVTALFTITRIWKQPKCPETDEWIRKFWYMYTMECYSTKKDKFTSFAATWMELEGLMLAEISQEEKEKYWAVSLICGTKGKQTNRQEN